MLREQREHMFYELAVDTGVIDEGYFMEAAEKKGIFTRIIQGLQTIIKKIKDFFVGEKVKKLDMDEKVEVSKDAMKATSKFQKGLGTFKSKLKEFLTGKNVMKAVGIAFLTGGVLVAIQEARRRNANTFAYSRKEVKAELDRIDYHTEDMLAEMKKVDEHEYIATKNMLDAAKEEAKKSDWANKHLPGKGFIGRFKTNYKAVNDKVLKDAQDAHSAGKAKYDDDETRRKKLIAHRKNMEETKDLVSFSKDKKDILSKLIMCINKVTSFLMSVITGTKKVEGITADGNRYTNKMNKRKGTNELQEYDSDGFRKKSISGSTRKKAEEDGNFANKSGKKHWNGKEDDN